MAGFALGAIALLWIASALTLILWPRYFRRLAKRHELAHEIADPERGAMLATFPAGLLVLAIGWGSVGQQTLPSGIALSLGGLLLAVGGLMALIYSALWASVISRAEVAIARSTLAG